MYTSLVGFNVVLDRAIKQDDTYLPIHKRDKYRLEQLLGDNYTYLTFRNNISHEIVKAKATSDGEIMIERGVEGTTPINAPFGTCVTFTWVKSSIEDIVEEKLNSLNKLVSSIKGGDCFEVLNNDGEFTINKKPSDELSFIVGDKKYTQNKCGSLTQSDAENARPLEDGKYENATIVVRDGRIYSIEAGSNIIHSLSGGRCL